MISQDLIRVIRQGFKLDWRGVHGAPHWVRVRENGLRIGKAVGANLTVVELFAFLHDSQRIHDESDPNHGKRAAEFAESLRGSVISLSDFEFELLRQACLLHSNGLTEADITIQTCWDADRLDLGRVGIKPQAGFLCTDFAKAPATIKWAYSRSIGALSRAIYMTKTNTQPEEAFEIGTLHYLVAGNSARLKDARGTPAKIVEVTPATGMFVIEIQDFEDKGAKWEESLENVRNYQFVQKSRVASDEEVAELEAAVSRFDRPLSIKCDSASRTETVARLVEERRAVGAWLSQNARFLAERRTLPPVETRAGAPQLCEDLRQFMNSRGLWEMEDAFARQFVSYPHSGELVKGHRIVLAEMGLVPYDGKVIRNPDLFDGFWSKEQRARHILARLAFVHEVFAQLGISRLILYRGISRNGPLIRHQNHTFVSSTFSREVAEAHFDGPSQGMGVLYRQNVSVQRVFMTYFETIQMNRQYKEAEAILLFDNGNLAF